MAIDPQDDSDLALRALVRPPDWRNPEPAPLYDLVVLGGGTAGLVSAAGAAGLGAKVALVERELLGGDCLNTGCVPSKSLLRSARAVDEARRGAAAGVMGHSAVDFARVMARLRERRSALAHLDSAARFTSLGVDVFFGDASFTDRRTVAVGGRLLRFRRAVIATGARPAAPPIPGLADGPHLTSDSLFSLAEPPARLLVLGGGPVGCEMAQAFALLGSQVTLIDRASRLLPWDDPDAAAIVSRRLEHDGVRLLLGVSPTGVTYGAADATVRWTSGEVTGNAVLVATGRTPNVEGLHLASAGVVTGPGGVQVDDRLRTSNRRIYAAGDVCSSYRFTHAADAMARTVVQNALFFGRKRFGALVIPWCTYTFPEVAGIGLIKGTHQSREDSVGPPGLAVRERVGSADCVTIPLTEVDRSLIDGDTDGFVRIHHLKGRIVGATIVAPHAGELIGHVAHLLRTGGTLGDLSATVFPYPTVAEAMRKAGDRYRRGSLTPAVRSLLKGYFRLLRW
ncbi:MAG: mercuric reductase [Vicinamibacterales bacterium]